MPEFENEPPMVVVPVGSVTVPVVIVKSFDDVAKLPENAQLPPEPLNTMLKKLDEPGIIVLPVVVATKLIVPLCDIKELLLVQLPRISMEKLLIETSMTPPFVTFVAFTFEPKASPFVFPKTTTLPMSCFATLESVQVLVAVPMNVVDAFEPLRVNAPDAPIMRSPPRRSAFAPPCFKVPKFIENVELALIVLPRVHVAVPAA